MDKPLDNDIDVGYYDSPNMLFKSESIMVGFYKISKKINVCKQNNTQKWADRFEFF